jgi:hypothetical protein
MTDEIRVTVIATGFERTGVARQLFERPYKAAPSTADIEMPPSISAPEDHTRPSPVSPNAPAEEFKARTFNTDDLDIPTFLRKRNR